MTAPGPEVVADAPASAARTPAPPPATASEVVPREFVAHMDAWMARKRPRRVLEAGCGSTSHIGLPEGAEVVGVDISPSQLERNTTVHRRIVGDIQHHDFGSERFDLVVCWNVLEHVPHPGRALRNLCSALAEGGCLVIAVPNLWSAKGLVTRSTPFAMHALFYRLMGDRSVGTAEFGQFPTYLRREMAPRRLRQALEAEGLSVSLFLEYEGPVQRALRRKSRLADVALALLGRLSRAGTSGRHDLNHSDAILVAERGAAAPGERPGAGAGEVRAARAPEEGA